MKIPKGWQIISTLFSKGWQKGWKTNTFFGVKGWQIILSTLFGCLVYKESMFFLRKYPPYLNSKKKGGKFFLPPFCKRVVKGWQGYCEPVRKGWKKGGPPFFPLFLEPNRLTALYKIKGGKVFPQLPLRVRTREIIIKIT